MSGEKLIFLQNHDTDDIHSADYMNGHIWMQFIHFIACILIDAAVVGFYC